MRIVLPWVVGVSLLASPLAYMIYFSRHFPASFLDFFAGDFWGKAYQQSHHWFIGVLMGFVLVATVIASVFPALLEKPKQGDRPGLFFHLGMMVLATALFMLGDHFFALDAWIHPGYVFVFQPVRIGGLFLFFMLGIYCERSGWFSVEGYSPRALPWGGVAFGSGVLYLLFKLTFPEMKLTSLALHGANALLFNVFCYSAIVFLFAVCKRRMNRRSPCLKHFTDNSYGSYYVHAFFAFGVAYALTGIHLSVYLKFSVTDGIGHCALLGHLSADAKGVLTD